MNLAETVLAHPGEIWILSAERAGLQPDENARRADTLETLAKGLLLGATLLPAFGVWEGSRERSLVILVPPGSREAFKARVETFVLSAAEAYQQDAVIHRPPGAPAGLFMRDDERSGGVLFGAGDVLTAGHILAPDETPQGWTEFPDGSRLTF